MIPNAETPQTFPKSDCTLNHLNPISHGFFRGSIFSSSLGLEGFNPSMPVPVKYSLTPNLAHKAFSLDLGGFCYALLLLGSDYDLRDGCRLGVLENYGFVH